MTRRGQRCLHYNAKRTLEGHALNSVVCCAGRPGFLCRARQRWPRPVPATASAWRSSRRSARGNMALYTEPTRTCGRSLRAHGRWHALPAGGCSRPRNVGLRQLVVTRCSANQDLFPNDVLLCSTCRTFIGARPPSVPPLCVANGLAVSEVPECIAVLNPMELRLVTQVRGLTCYLCSRNLLPPLLLLPLAAAASCCCLLLPLLQVLNTGLPHPHPHPTHTLTLQTCRVPA